MNSLEQSLARIPLSNNSYTQDNLRLSVKVTQRTGEDYNGVTYARLTNQQSRIIYGNDSKIDKAVTSISLPSSLLNYWYSATARFIFVLYNNSLFFQHEHLRLKSSDDDLFSRQVNSEVISASVRNASFANLTDPVKMVFKPLQAGELSSASCVYWDFQALGALGNWSAEGCTVVMHRRSQILCECNHLTNFALLVVSESKSNGIRNV